MSFSEMFYENVLPIMTLAAFLYIIYLLFFREAHFDKIEEKFERAIRKNMESSENVINGHFDKSQDILIDALNRFSKEARDELNETLDNIKMISKTQRELNEDIKEQEKVYMKLVGVYNELTTHNEQLQDMIKQRDAVIERRTEQLKRLSN